MEDRIETIGQGSIIQHGKLNNRIYLIKLAREDGSGLLDSLRKLARENSYTKIFCKVPEWAVPLFIADGYMTEAIIPRFYQGKTAAFFLAKYLDSDRLMFPESQRLEALGGLLKSAPRPETLPKQDAFPIRQLGIELQRIRIEETENNFVEYFGN